MKNIELTKEQIYKLTIMCFTLLPKYFNNELLKSRVESNEFNLKNYYLINGHGKIHYVDIDNPSYVFADKTLYEIKNDVNWLSFLLTTFQDKLYTVYDTFICGTGADYFNDLICENGINSKLIDKMFEQFEKIDNKTFKFYNLIKKK